MLKELHISNYRLFDELHIPDLGQVNLIAGKNNTGKTALLEALRIWAAEGDSTVVNNILDLRGEFIDASEDSYKTLFKNYKPSDFKIGNLSIYFGIAVPENDSVAEEISNYYVLPPSRGIKLTKPVAKHLNPYITSKNPKDKSIFVPFNNPHFPFQILWDKIVLTPLENDVLEILKIIEPRIQRIDIKEENSRVLLEGDSTPIPLKSLGDGINRLLWVAVALVSAKNSQLLLIDEFEAGLHHSVQEMLWEKIFFYAQQWNIQVFVTTHSLDAVRTFQSVADRPENQGKGRFFRLQRNAKGEIEAVRYGEEELATAIEFDLETR